MTRAVSPFLFLLFLVSCTGQKAESDSVPDDATMMSTEALAWRSIRDGAQLIDVRTPEEFAQGHLDGAVNIPHGNIGERIDEITQDKGDHIVLYCRSGRRSGIAQRTLLDLGYTSVMNAGGYEALLRAKE